MTALATFEVVAERRTISGLLRDELLVVGDLVAAPGLSQPAVSEHRGNRAGPA